MNLNKKFVFRSVSSFRDYKNSSNWAYRCSQFMDPTQPFEMLWDGEDFTKMAPSDAIESEFLMRDVYAFDNKEQMDSLTVPYGAVGSYEETNINKILLSAIQELTIEVKRVGKVVDQIRFSQQ